MKIDVTQQLTGLDGTPMTTGRQICQACGQVVGKTEPMTVRVAATRALSVTFRDEQGLRGEERVERFHLALKIINEDEPNLTVEEIALIKKLTGKLGGNVVAGRMWAILDPPEKAE